MSSTHRESVGTTPTTSVELAPTRKRLFITGGTGFVGKTLLDHLIATHATDGAFPFATVDVLSRDPATFLQQYPHYADRPWLNFISGSLTQLPPEDVPYTHIIHAAADTHRPNAEIEWLDQLIGGTRAMLDFALRHGKPRFLMVSSGAIYGTQPWDLAGLTEDYAGAPATTSIRSLYGQGKRLAEQLCTLYHYHHGLETVIARCFAFCGNHLPLDGPYALGNFIRDALTRDFIQVSGDGTAIRSYLDGKDLAHWLMTLLTDGIAGEAYNVGSDQAISIGELAQRVAALATSNIPVQIQNRASGIAPASRYVPAIGKARALGLEVTIDLNTSIENAVTDIRHSDSPSTKHIRPDNVMGLKSND